MSREYIEHALCIGCAQLWPWLVCITYDVMAKLMRQAEPSTTCISCTVNDSDSKIADLNIRKYSVITWSRWTFAQLSHRVGVKIPQVHRILTHDAP